MKNQSNEKKREIWTQRKGAILTDSALSWYNYHQLPLDAGDSDDM